MVQNARLVSLRLRCRAAAARVHRIDRTIELYDRTMLWQGHSGAFRQQILADMRELRDLIAAEGTSYPRRQRAWRLLGRRFGPKPDVTARWRHSRE